MHGTTDGKELLIRVEPIIISISSSMAPIKTSIDSLREDISNYKGDDSLRLSAELEELEREYRKADDKQRRLKKLYILPKKLNPFPALQIKLML